MLQDPEIDCVYISLPNSHHKEWAIKSLQAGKHVLCEKPMASNAEECAVMHAEAQKCGLILMEAFHYRYHPLFERVIEIVTHGKVVPTKGSSATIPTVGEVTHAEAALCFPIFSGSDIRYNYALSGGAMMDAGTYTVNCVRTILEASNSNNNNDNAITVEKAQCKLAYPNVDQSTTATFKCGNKTATITTSLFQLIPSISLTVKFDCGAVLSATNWVAPQMLYNSLTLANCKNSSDNFSVSFPRDVSTYEHQLNYFCNAVVKHKETGTANILTSTADAIKNQALIDDVYKHMNLPVRGTKV